MEYRSTATHAEIARRLRAARRPFVTTHFKPDGDALGSVLALSRALAGLGATVRDEARAGRRGLGALEPVVPLGRPRRSRDPREPHRRSGERPLSAPLPQAPARGSVRRTRKGR